jgi:hypothetical protein
MRCDGKKARKMTEIARPPNHALNRTARKRRLRVPSSLRSSARLARAFGRKGKTVRQAHLSRYGSEANGTPNFVGDAVVCPL